MKTDLSARKNAKKTRGRPFMAGNPGRPRGARNRATLAAEALLSGQSERLTEKCIQMAMSGDTAAMRLALDRILPARRERPLRIRLPDLQSPADIEAAAREIVAAVADGVLCPGEGQAIMSLVEAVARCIELGEIEQRLAALEGRTA